MNGRTSDSFFFSFFFSTLQAVDDYDTKITQKKKSLISKS